MPLCYLVDGKPVCISCVPENHPINPISVYRENIHPYSQTCCRCFKIIHEGTSKTELFPFTPPEELFNEDSLRSYREEFAKTSDHDQQRRVMIAFLKHVVKAAFRGVLHVEWDKIIVLMEKMQ